MEKKTISFSAALNEMVQHGAKIRRQSWQEKQTFELKDGLILFTDPAGQQFPINVVYSADVLADNWEIVGETLQTTFIPA